MPSLFSHAHEPDYVVPSDVEKVQQSVVVDVPVDQAFDGFADSLHLWWPVAEQSVFGDGSHIAILRDHLVEESVDGEEIVWAEILEWELGALISFHWTLGDERFGSSDVDVRFDETHDGMTSVTISWEQVSTHESDSSDGFICDWSLILSRYARFMGGDVSLD